MNGIDIITGTDSGMGKSLTQIYLNRGKKVLISYLNQNPFSDNPNVIAIPLDLLDKNSIKHFNNEVHNYLKTENLTVHNLFLNAAIGMGGTVENTPMEIYRRSMEVNFFGVISIIQALLPIIIKSKGRIIIHGSMGGRISLPFLSPYSASKYALEALTDSLRREVTPFGIQICILETAGVATPIWEKVLQQDLSFIDKRYKRVSENFMKQFVYPANKGLKPDRAATSIYRLINRDKLPHRYRISKNSFVTFLPLMLPSRLLDSIIWNRIK